MSIITTLVAADKRRLERQILCVAAQKQKALLNSKARERKNPSLDRNYKGINFFDATKRDLQKFKKLLSKNILHVRFTSTMNLRTEKFVKFKTRTRA